MNVIRFKGKIFVMVKLLFAKLRKFIDSSFPWLARCYRELRDRRIVSRRKFFRTTHGFEFIGVESMETSRDQSGESALVIKNLELADVFVDGGSNTGFFAMLAGQAEVHTLALEPQPHNFKLLIRNIERNRFKGIEARQIALGRNRSRMKLFGGGEGASLHRNWGGMKSTYHTEVDVESLDNLLADRFLTLKLFIKLDLEGHEYEALRGAARLLARSTSPVWLVEIGFKENFNDLINPDFSKIFDLFGPMVMLLKLQIFKSA